MRRSSLERVLVSLVLASLVAGCGAAREHFRYGAIAVAVGSAVATTTASVVGESCADHGDLCPSTPAGGGVVLGLIGAGLLVAAGGSLAMVFADDEPGYTTEVRRSAAATRSIHAITRPLAPGPPAMQPPLPGGALVSPPEPLSPPLASAGSVLATSSPPLSPPESSGSGGGSR